MTNYFFRYVRHSDDAVNQPNSRNAQLMIIDAWLAAERLRNPDFCNFQDAGEYYDNNISGGKALASRTAGGVMMGRAKRGDVIIAAKWDRLVRDNMDFENILRRVLTDNIRLVCIDFQVDTGTAAGRLVARIMVSVATLEREKAAERIIDGKKALKYTRNVSICLAQPIGWKRVRQHEQTNKHGVPYMVLVPYHEERREARYLNRLHEEGKGYGTIVEYLHKSRYVAVRYRNKERNILWSPTTVRDRIMACQNDFPARPECVDGRNNEQLMIEVPAQG